MATLLTHAAQLLTLRGADTTAARRGRHMAELGIIEDGAVLDRGPEDRRRRARPTRSPDTSCCKSGPVEEIECRGKVVLPGFVDSHTHPVFTASRLVDFEKRTAGANYEEIAAAGGGIRASLRGVRESSRQELAAHVLRALNEMAAQGTTTVEAKSGYGLSFEAEIKSLEAIRGASQPWQGTVVPTLLGAHVVAPEYRENPGRICPHCVRRDDSGGGERRPGPARIRRLAEFVDVFCERGAFSMQQSQRILRAAVDHGLGVRVHVCQLTPAELAPLLEFHPASLDHMDFVSDADLAASGEE